MPSDLVHAETMRRIAVIVAYFYQSILMYMKLNLLIRLCEKKATIRQKLILALLCGGICVAFIDFPRLKLIESGISAQMMPFFISIPGVIITTLCFFFCVFSLKLTALRTLEVTVYSYLYFQAASGVSRMAGSLFFAPDQAMIDYSIYIQRYILNFIIMVAIFKGMSCVLKNKPHLLIIKSGSDTKPNTSVAFSVFQLCYVYFCAAVILVLVPDTAVANFISLLLLVVFTALCIVLSNNRYAQAEIHDKTVHIQSLFSSLNEFSSVKHDFFNILQTYNGYFALGDLEACKRYHQTLVEITTQAGNLLDLGRRAVENPALIALFLSKNDQAQKLHVRLNIDVGYPLNDLQMEDIDLCRVASCLLDNAIEAASVSKEKLVSFTVERKTDFLLMITIINSVDEPVNIDEMFPAGATSKAGHHGLGLANVKKIIEKYPYCEFEIKSAQREVTACIKISGISESAKAKAQRDITM